ncbi:hypothetical protein OIU84_000651, partial [Salix udensis]
MNTWTFSVAMESEITLRSCYSCFIEEFPVPEFQEHRRYWQLLSSSLLLSFYTLERNAV